MTKPTRPLPSHDSAQTKIETLAADLLIFVGIVFQWLEISYRHTNLDNLWYISLALRSLWRMAEFYLYTPVWRDALRFSPLAFLAAGIVMLWSGRRVAISRAPKEENNA